MAKEVDKSGRVIVMTTHKELAELKRDQILGYGADPRLSRSRGSMAAIIEPADL
jgi:ATP-dependent Clp protease adaptor protein ClpS